MYNAINTLTFFLFGVLFFKFKHIYAPDNAPYVNPRKHGQITPAALSDISKAGLPLKKPRGDADDRRRAKYQRAFEALTGAQQVAVRILSDRMAKLRREGKCMRCGADGHRNRSESHRILELNQLLFHCECGFSFSNKLLHVSFVVS